MANILDSLISPASTALIGAGEDATTFSGAPLANLLRHNWGGRIYPINPSRTTIRDLKCYPSLSDVPEVPEAAVITIAARHAVQAVADCAVAGVKTVTLVSSGFGEGSAGAAGTQLQEELEAALAGHSMRLLGPNTTGVINLWDQFVPRAAHNHLDPNLLRAGPVALVTQSGACSNIVFNRAQHAGVAVGCAIATGGQMDLDVWEISGALIDDPRVQVVMMVVEDLSNGEGLEIVARRAADLGKSLVLLKLGQGEVGGAAVLAHSASLAGDAKVQKAVCHALGVHWVDDFDALWEVASLLQHWGRPTESGGRLGVIAFSGGEGALIADAAERVGLSLPEPGPDMIAVVKDNFSYAVASNPFDPSGEVIGDPTKLTSAIRAFCRDDAYSDLLLASPIFGEGLASKLYPHVSQALAGVDARVVMSSWHVDGLTQVQDQFQRKQGRPVIDDSVRAVQAVATYYNVKRTERARADDAQNGVGVGVGAGAGDHSAAAIAAGSSYSVVREALAAAGLVFGAARVVHGQEDPAQAADAIRFPLVAKADVPSTTHKSALGLVVTGLRSHQRVQAEVARLLEHADAVVLEEQASGELQILLGIHRDPAFGPVLVVGSGGVTVETLTDTALVPLRHCDLASIKTAFAQTAVGKYLTGRSEVIVDAVADQAWLMADWFTSQPHLASVEVNPAFIDLGDQTIICADARIN